eukprot:9729585-Heterocapsa_arctica.AAC.1
MRAKNDWRAGIVAAALVQASACVRYCHMQRSRPWARYPHGVWFQAYRGKTGAREAFRWYAPSASLTGVDA